MLSTGKQSGNRVDPQITPESVNAKSLITRLFGRTETQAEAADAVHQASIAFYFLAGIHFLLALDRPYFAIETVSAIKFLVFGALLQTSKNRLLAWLALVLAVANVLGTIRVMLITRSLATVYVFVELWAAIRAVQGTSALWRLGGARTQLPFPTVIRVGRWLVSGYFGMVGVLSGYSAVLVLMKRGPFAELQRRGIVNLPILSIMILLAGLVEILAAAGIYNLRLWGGFLGIVMCVFVILTLPLTLIVKGLPRWVIVDNAIWGVITIGMLLWFLNSSVMVAFQAGIQVSDSSSQISKASPEQM